MWAFVLPSCLNVRMKIIKYGDENQHKVLTEVLFLKFTNFYNVAVRLQFKNIC